MGGDSCSNTGWTIFHILFVVKFVMCIWNDENKWKEAGVGPFIKSLNYGFQHTDHFTLQEGIFLSFCQSKVISWSCCPCYESVTAMKCYSSGILHLMKHVTVLLTLSPLEFYNTSLCIYSYCKKMSKKLNLSWVVKETHIQKAVNSNPDFGYCTDIFSP